MIRHCNGQDPNLVAEDGKTPCTCGSFFDDVEWMVNFPHQQVHGAISLKQRAEEGGMQILTSKGLQHIIGPVTFSSVTWDASTVTRTSYQDVRPWWKPDIGWKWLKWTFGFWVDPKNNTIFGIDFGPLEIVWHSEGYRP